MVIWILILAWSLSLGFCNPEDPRDEYAMLLSDQHNSKIDSESVTQKLNSTSFAAKISDFFDNNAIFGIFIGSIIFLQALTLFLMGQPFISRSGKVRLWEGNINSTENSQHIFDWYTFTHVLHGFIFYGIAAGFIFLFPVIDIGVKGVFILALLVEVIWEALENSPPVINRYRQTALANGYTGDSIINSISDVGAMSIGFWMSHILPIWATISLTLVEEMVLALLIRDNLTLNVLQLLHPFEAVSKWQANGGILNQPRTENLRSDDS